MQPKFTKLFTKSLRFFSMLLFFFCFFAFGANSQITLTTEAGTGYTGGNTRGAVNSQVSFVIDNTSGSAMLLTQVDCHFGPPNSNSNITLWYSSTSLSGPLTTTAPTWQVVGSGSIGTIPANGYYTAVSGLSFIIPAGTQYRFALQSTIGLNYSCCNTPPNPTPNIFTSGGVSLKVGDFQIAGQNVGYAGDFPGPVTLFNPRFFTGRVHLTNAAPCSGTPTPGNTVTSGPNPICPGINFTLSAQNNTPGSGVTYQWESAPGVGGPWTIIGGATNPTYTTSLVTTPLAYRVQVTCSGNTGTSNPLLVNMNPPSSCYCTPTYANGCTLGDYIARVRLLSIDNTTTCSTPPYTYYSAITAPTLIAGGTYQLIVNVGPDTFGQWVGAWIDFNSNGSFADAGEFLATPVNAGANGQVTVNFTVPAGATVGPTRLRIRAGDDVAMTAAQSCGASNSSFGEAEDYNVTIAPCIQGSFTAQPVNRSIQCGGTTTFSATNNGSLLTYQWEYRVNSSALWQNVPNAAPYSGANTNTLTITDAPSTFNGYQYRLVVVGACTATDFSNVATLTVTPLVATVTPSSATICTGSIQQLSITNVLGTPPVTTVSFPSGPLSLAIPDNTPNGVNHTVNVSGIPAGAVVGAARVTLNMTHTWAGDMVYVLRAPNGQILNLDWYLSGTGGAGATTGFTNTVISSTGTALLSSGSNPYTGTFRADLAAGAAGFPAGPNGFLPTTATWSALWGGTPNPPNGAWTLAMYDGGPADLGVLTSWTLTLEYTAPAFATGIWSANPSSPNTMFTDPAATVPYTGTPVTTIYVKPTVNTVYSVVVTTPTPCTSGPTNVAVNVVNPVSGVVNPANRSVCVGGSTTFSVTASGGPISYQWQVSTNGGASYSNISGATSSTLTLNNVAQTMHNNLYRVVLSAPPCAGTTTTTAATLTVNPLPTVLLSANPTAIKPGVTTTITVNSTPAGATYSWTFNGQPLTGVTGSSYVANVDGIGTYTVTVTDVNGCTSTSSPFTITGQQDNRLFIYPNPAPDGMFQVRLFSGINFDYRKVNIYNAAGVRVAQREFPTSGPWEKMEFNLSNQASGVYMVEVVDRYDTKLASGKVVIQR